MRTSDWSSSRPHGESNKYNTEWKEGCERGHTAWSHSYKLWEEARWTFGIRIRIAVTLDGRWYWKRPKGASGSCSVSWPGGRWHRCTWSVGAHPRNTRQRHTLSLPQWKAYYELHFHTQQFNSTSTVRWTGQVFFHSTSEKKRMAPGVCMLSWNSHLSHVLPLRLTSRYS